MATRADGRALIYVDRHLLHERDAPDAFRLLEETGRPVARPDLTFAVQDHTVATAEDRPFDDASDAAVYIRAQRENTARHGISLFDIGDPEQGISHVVAPEQGIVLPGLSYACPDSHACTVGAIGTLAFGTGASETAHILATRTLALRKPRTMRICLDGRLGSGLSAKDAALRTVAETGVGGALGCAVEFAGPVVRSLSVEGRLTLCNMAIEMGARSALIAPDDTTVAWLEGRPFAPRGADWNRAVEAWRNLCTDDGAAFDEERTIDCTGLAPQISWGIDPSQVVAVDERVPAADGPRGERALSYMALQPDTPIEGVAIDRVFIGSCTNARLADLEDAARILRGRKVADGVAAFAVPGSTAVRRAAEAKGLDRVFRDAGFVWGQSGCSMCTGGNGDRGAPGERCVSTTNRNFENRQGPGVRTHLASPAMTAAAAVTGRITDVRRLLAGDA